jgi:hypothetical protein
MQVFGTDGFGACGHGVRNAVQHMCNAWWPWLSKHEGDTEYNYHHPMRGLSACWLVPGSGVSPEHVLFCVITHL